MDVAKSDLLKKGGRVLLGLLMVLLLFGYLGGVSEQFLKTILRGSFDFSNVTYSPIPIWYHAFTTSEGWAFTLILFALIALLLLLSRWRDSILDLVLFTDDRGVGFARRGTYGTATWLRKKDIQDSVDLDLRPIEMTSGFILSQLDKKSKEVVSLRTQRKGNFNIAVLGASGTGKSAGFVRANVLNAIERGESVVLTDPKGELYTDFFRYCEDKGISAKVFNLLYPEYSDAWDIMGETVNPDTGEADPDRMASLATVIIENTGTSKEAIWNDGPKNLISAIGLWAMWRKESYLKNAYKSILDELDNSDALGELTTDRLEWVRMALLPKSDLTLKKREAAIRHTIEHSSFSEEAKQELWNRYTLGCPEASLATIYQTLAEYGDNVGHLFADMPDGHPGKIAYHFYEQAGEKVKSSFNQGLGVRLRLLQSRAMRRIIRNKDIDLADVGAHQTVIFVVIPDQDTSTRAISSMFFTFLFKDLADEYTRTQGEGRIPVNIILDEFANIGTIPDFAQKMSISRSRKINISYIIQSPAQLEAVYGRENAPTIIAGCDTMLFLGSSEPDTCKYVSRRTGEATISVNTIKNTRGVARPDATAKEYQESAGEGKRLVMTEHEISQMSKDECLVFLVGHNVLKARKFWWWFHPLSNGGKLPQTLITDHIRAAEKYKSTELKDPFLAGMNDSFQVDDFEGEALKHPTPPVAKKEASPKPMKSANGNVAPQTPKPKRKKHSLLGLLFGNPKKKASTPKGAAPAPRKGSQKRAVPSRGLRPQAAAKAVQPVPSPRPAHSTPVATPKPTAVQESVLPVTVEPSRKEVRQPEVVQSPSTPVEVPLESVAREENPSAPVSASVEPISIQKADNPAPQETPSQPPSEPAPMKANMRAVNRRRAPTRQPRKRTKQTGMSAATHEKMQALEEEL